MPFNGTGIGTWTDYPNPAGNSTFIELFAYGNTITGDIFGIMLLVSIFTVIFIVGSGKDPDGALASSAFITTMLSYLLVAMGALNNWVAVAMTFILMATIVMLYNKGGNVNV